VLLGLVLFALCGSLLVGVAGGVYSLAAHMVVRRFGRPHLVVLWFAASVGLAAIGTRKLPPARRAGADVHDINIPGLFALLLAWLLVIFAVPTFVAWRRARSPDAHASPSGAAIGGAGWTIVGLLLAISIAVVLKDAGVRFTPVR
jgi:hypothetical protein